MKELKRLIKTVLLVQLNGKGISLYLFAFYVRLFEVFQEQNNLMLRSFNEKKACKK